VTARPRSIVIQSEELDPSAAAWLRERCDLVEIPRERLASLNGHASPALAEARGLIVRTYTRVDAALLGLMPSLRVVGRAGVGLENIDQAACRERGIRVVHTPDANSSAVAEYVIALIFDAIRPRLFLKESVTARRWGELRKELRAPRQLCEMTVGILGLGRVGSRVARAAGALGARVLFHDLVEIAPADRHGATFVDPRTLRQESDILTVHIDNRPGNTGLVNEQFLSECRRGVVLINTSRGHIVDSDALAAFLRHDPSAMALLDVHAAEPFDDHYPLLDLPNAHLAPHLGAATELANRNMSWVVRDVWQVLSDD
jgi:phosphoglycerate dehydrogenase-like enzyme